MTSFLAGFVVFSILGYMALQQGKDIDKVAVEGKYKLQLNSKFLLYVKSWVYIMMTWKMHM